MRLIACLSWYEESPTWLAATVASLTKIGADHLVALDGAYALYPGGRACSGPEQHNTIQQTCRAIGIGCTIHTPRTTWAGGEVEKRTRLFDYANLEAQPDDWLFIIDADEVVTAGDQLKQKLAATDLDVAQVSLWHRNDPLAQNERVQQLARQHRIDETSSQPLRCVFRAIPGLHVWSNHFTYRTPDNRYLWGHEDLGLEPALDLTDVCRIEHRNQYRTKARTQDRLEYYRARDAAGVEHGDCIRCGEQATRWVPWFPEPVDNGVATGHAESCDQCTSVLRDELDVQIRKLGYDPTTLVKSGKATVTT